MTHDTHRSSTARRWLRHVAGLVILLACRPPDAALAQTFEVAPLAGYRFGNDLFELAANRSVDTDGAPVVGLAVNVAMWNGLSFEGMVSRQKASVSGLTDAFDPPTR